MRIRVRCALEEPDSGDVRLDKLVELIRENPRSIHDLSRTEIGENDLPRFNMPFELGLALGAKRFGRRPRDRIKIMVNEPYRMPRSCQPHRVIRIARNYLQKSPKGGSRAGPRRLLTEWTIRHKRADI